jgi:hypothetical protein
MMINGNVCFEIRKYRGTNRINIDDMIIDDNGALLAVFFRNFESGS